MKQVSGIRCQVLDYALWPSHLNIDTLLFRLADLS